MIKILFVCHGNICRSAMAEAMMNYKVDLLGLSDKFIVDSAATSNEAEGYGMYHAAVAKLNEHQIPIGNHRARKMRYDDYEEFDHIICMDRFNYTDIMRITSDDPDNKVRKMLKYVDSEEDVADPWYTRDFETTYRQLDRSIDAFLKKLLCCASY